MAQKFPATLVPALARTLPLAEADLPGLYVRMREQRLTGHVVQGDESFATFSEIFQQGGLFKEVLAGPDSASGEIVAFWWTTPVYAAAYCFHFCLFKPHRHLAAALFGKIRRGLRAAGVDVLLCPVPRWRRDLRRFCQAGGLKPGLVLHESDNQSKEIEIWVAN